MDLTQGTDLQKRRRSRKMLLWFSMAGMTMMFAGLTSAYVVSTSREDWIEGLGLPPIFLWSTVVIVLSSIALIFTVRAVKRGQHGLASILLTLAFVLGFLFGFLQIKGFTDIVAEGYYPAGGSSTINVSFYYVIIFAHLLHVLSGLIVLSVLIYNHFKKRYNPQQTLGLEIGTTFWHFLDFIWIYLFLFMGYFG